MDPMDTPVTTTPLQDATTESTSAEGSAAPSDDFEVAEHQIPWFLWLFFLLIISWAGIAWMPIFGY